MRFFWVLVETGEPLPSHRGIELKLHDLQMFAYDDDFNNIGGCGAVLGTVEP